MKTRDDNLKSIYEKLALNEQATAKCIEQEILAMDKNGRILMILNLIEKKRR